MFWGMFAWLTGVSAYQPRSLHAMYPSLREENMPYFSYPMGKSIVLAQLWRPLINLDNINIQTFGYWKQNGPCNNDRFMVPVFYFFSSNADLFAAVEHQQDEKHITHVS